MKKVLIITYYWPPSGGAGVQRWLKLSKYLAQRGVEVHVVSVDPSHASYMLMDESLTTDIHRDVTVHLTKSFEPINFYAKLVGKHKVPVAGFSNVDNTSWKQKIVTAIRSNLFIPDPRKGWNRYAYRKAVEIIENHGISQVITTSPPHSSQLIGLKLKRKFKSNINWIADFRDPWTDIYYYDLLQHSMFSHMIDKRYERNVLEESDAIITVGDVYKDSFLSKSHEITEDKISIITNGYDTDDFNLEDVEKCKDFTFSYIGTMSDHYEPEVFVGALSKLMDKYSEHKIIFKLVGVVSENIRKLIDKKIGASAIFIPSVPHDEAIEYMIEAHVLLLITPGERGPTPGKTFEYLATQNRIVCIGKGGAAQLIADCKAGESFDRGDKEELFQYMEAAFLDFLNNRTFIPDVQEILKHSRSAQAQQVIDLLSS